MSVGPSVHTYALQRSIRIEWTREKTDWKSNEKNRIFTDRSSVIAFGFSLVTFWFVTVSVEFDELDSLCMFLMPVHLQTKLNRMKTTIECLQLQLQFDMIRKSHFHLPLYCSTQTHWDSKQLAIPFVIAESWKVLRTTCIYLLEIMVLFCILGHCCL